LIQRIKAFTELAILFFVVQTGLVEIVLAARGDMHPEHLSLEEVSWIFVDFQPCQLLKSGVAML
jgi:hypothetical protein